jgi:hypothetical protein
MFLFTTPPSRPSAPGTPVVDAIRQGAERTGVGFDYLLATARKESALNPNAQARTSSASGLFQFIEQTWLGLIKSDGDKIGLSDYARAVSTRTDGTHAVTDPNLRQEILALRQDPQVASVMAGALTQKNRDVLSAALGREPSHADLYVAHFLGARGAADLIRAAQQSPGRAVAADFPDAASANRSIFYDRDGRARGAGEVYALLTQARTAAAPSVASSTDGQDALPQQDGPAFHGLFQSGLRRGPVSEAVAKIWRHGRGDGRTEAVAGFFPSSGGATSAEPDPAPIVQETAPAVPLPPPRPVSPSPASRASGPLDLSTFMAWRKG